MPTFSADQSTPTTVTLICGSHALCYIFRNIAVDGFTNAAERAASFAYTMAGDR